MDPRTRLGSQCHGKLTVPVDDSPPVSDPAAPARLAAFLLALTLSVSPAPAAVTPRPSDFHPRHVLLQPRPGTLPAELSAIHATLGARVLKSFEAIRGLQLVQLPDGMQVPAAIDQYERTGLVAFAEPDFRIHASLAPNDPRFLDGTLWDLENTGQAGGRVDADIDAPAAWDLRTSAEDIVVAVIDSGINLDHEDLSANLWTHPPDGSHGWNAIDDTNLPIDDSGHGSLVAGVLGAVGNNGLGITGVAWKVQMMACKCLAADNSGTDSALIECIDFARKHRARLLNISLDSPEPSSALLAAIESARDAGILIVASAGNGFPARDIDRSPTYPASFAVDNLLTVAYTTRRDQLGILSNYGATRVHLAAPGDEVYSTYHTRTDAYYPPPGFITVAGTSFAAPAVVGACALLMAQFPSDTYRDTIDRVLGSVDVLPSLAGKCRTSGRLNLRRALESIRMQVIPDRVNGSIRLHVSAGVGRAVTIESSADLVHWTSVLGPVVPALDTVDFIDPSSTGSPQRFYRAATSP